MKNWKKIDTLMIKPINPNYTYQHGIVYGLDCTNGKAEINSSINTHDLMRLITDVQTTTYHALILDERLKNSNPSKIDKFTGKNISHQIERFNTDDPDKAVEFFYKYNQKDENN